MTLSYGLDYDQQVAALNALRDARKWVQHAHDDAEPRGPWSVVKETEDLLARIDGVLKENE